MRLDSSINVIYDSEIQFRFFTFYTFLVGHGFFNGPTLRRVNWFYTKSIFIKMWIYTKDLRFVCRKVLLHRFRPQQKLNFSIGFYVSKYWQSCSWLICESRYKCPNESIKIPWLESTTFYRNIYFICFLITQSIVVEDKFFFLLCFFIISINLK